MVFYISSLLKPFSEYYSHSVYTTIGPKTNAGYYEYTASIVRMRVAFSSTSPKQNLISLQSFTGKETFDRFLRSTSSEYTFEIQAISAEEIIHQHKTHPVSDRNL